MRVSGNNEPTAASAGAWAACLERLATALSGYPDLECSVRAEGPVPCLEARNTTVPVLSETVTVADTGDDLAYFWSWGRRIGDASAPGTAAHAIAYVLAARDARLDRQGGVGADTGCGCREARNERNADA